MSFRWTLPATVLALTFCVGCAQQCCHISRSHSGSVEFGLPTVERPRTSGTVELASLTTAIDAQPTKQLEYRGLTATECQCLAVENSAIGKLLDRERWTACLHEMSKSERRGRCLQLAVLRAASQEARNKSGADALRLYYGLAETEAGLDVIDDGLVQIADATAKIAQLKKQELEIPFDASEFERRRLTFESKRAELQATRAKLNAQLRALLGFDAMPDAALLFPTDALIATSEPIDTEAEVAHGLATRGEIEVLRLLAASDEETTTEAIKSLLGGVHGLAGMAVNSAAKKFAGSLLCSHDPEPCTRRNQIAELHASRSNQLAGEIRAAVEKIHARRRQAALAQEQADSWTRRIHELTQRRETGGSSFVQLIEARLYEVEARAGVTTAVIELKRAEMELRELQGAIAAECCGAIGTVGTTIASHAVPPTPRLEKLPQETLLKQASPLTVIPHPARNESKPQPPQPARAPQVPVLPPEEIVPPLPPALKTSQSQKSTPNSKLSNGSLFGPPPVGSPFILQP